jgi:hypothetical protein
MMKKEIAKLKEVVTEVNKQNDLLKKKYTTEVEQLKSTSEDENNNKSLKISEQE